MEKNFSKVASVPSEPFMGCCVKICVLVDAMRVCVCAQVDGHHADPAGSGGQSDVSGGGAADSGGAAGPQRDKGTQEDDPLLPLPEGAVHRAQVTVLRSAGANFSAGMFQTIRLQHPDSETFLLYCSLTYVSKDYFLFIKWRFPSFFPQV